MAEIRKKRKAVVAQEACVACGCCVKVVHGLFAQVAGDRCVGCGRCAKECPAAVIELREAAV